MRSIEQTGRTVEDAIRAAVKALGVSRDDVEVEVLAQETRGLLGILGTTQAKVRVTVKEGAARPEAAAPAPSPRPAPGPAREPVEQLPEEEFVPEETAGPPPPALAEASLLAVRARDLASEILRLMGVRAQAEIVQEDEEAILINIRDSSDLGLLIGKHGQTLGALQLIVAMIANRPVPQEERKRIILDAAGYRDRRERALQEMAKSAAERAKRSGREVPLQPLNARERRIVHVALADDTGVTTRSEGEDPERFIVIVPKRRRER